MEGFQKPTPMRMAPTSSGLLGRLELLLQALPRLALVEVQVILVDQRGDAAAHALAHLAAEHAEEAGRRGEDEPIVSLLEQPVLERLRNLAREFLDLHLLAR